MAHYRPDSAYHEALIKAHGKAKAMSMIRAIGGSPIFGNKANQKISEKLGRVYGAHKKSTEAEKKIPTSMEEID